jgi:hypothetical protein
MAQYPLLNNQVNNIIGWNWRGKKDAQIFHHFENFDIDWNKVTLNNWILYD